MRWANAVAASRELVGVWGNSEICVSRQGTVAGVIVAMQACWLGGCWIRCRQAWGKLCDSVLKNNASRLGWKGHGQCNRQWQAWPVCLSLINRQVMNGTEKQPRQSWRRAIQPT